MREMLKAAEYGWKTISAIHSSIDFQESGMPSTAEALEGISYVTARVAARHGALALLRIEQELEMEQDIRQGQAWPEGAYLSSEGVERATSGVFVGKLR